MFNDSYGNVRFPGLYRGIVKDSKDPLGRGRLRLQVPQILGDAITDWAWAKRDPGAPEATPAVGEGVWVQFEGGDPSYPVWVGTFVSTALNVGPTGPSGPSGPSGPAGPTGPTGAGGALGYYGSFYDMTDQVLASTSTAQVIAIGTTSESNGVSIENGDEVTFANAGTYSLTFSIQITNLANSVEKAIFWLKTNNVDYPDSATEIDLAPRKDASTPNRQVLTINYVATATAGQQVQVYWSGSSTQLRVESLPAGTSPVSPAVPSIILTAVQVMYTQLGPTGPIGPTGPVAAASPNYLINGGFDFWQRGTSFTADGYCADRWYFNETGACTVTQVTTALPAGFNYALQAVASTASTGDLHQALESSVVIPLRGKTVTFSCYLKMDATMRGLGGAFELIADYSTATDARASQTTAIGTVTIDKSLYTDWARASYTFTVPSDAVGLEVGIEPPAAGLAASTYSVAGAMLEVGSTATEFRRAGSTYTEEQNACYRYYYRANSGDTFSLMASGSYFNTTQAWFPFYTPVVLRVAPAFSWSGAFRLLGGGTARTITTLDLYTYQALNPVVLRATTASTTNGQTAALQTNDDATSYLEFDAEL